MNHPSSGKSSPSPVNSESWGFRGFGCFKVLVVVGVRVWGFGFRVGCFGCGGNITTCGIERCRALSGKRQRDQQGQ